DGLFGLCRRRQTDETEAKPHQVAEIERWQGHNLWCWISPSTNGVIGPRILWVRRQTSLSVAADRWETEQTARRPSPNGSFGPALTAKKGQPPSANGANGRATVTKPAKRSAFLQIGADAGRTQARKRLGRSLFARPEIEGMKFGYGSINMPESKAPRPGFEPGQREPKSLRPASLPLANESTSGEPPGAGDRALTKPAPETDPELARVLAAWPVLPAHIRAAILTLVGSASMPS